MNSYVINIVLKREGFTNPGTLLNTQSL